MQRLSVAVVLVVCLFAPAVVAQRPSSADEDLVDIYIRAEMQKRPIPGVAVAVIRDGRVRKLAAYGTSSLEFRTAVTPETLFNVASVSKTFTGVAIMRLVEDRALTLDDPIGRHLTELPTSWRIVTVRQLLNHTSGLPVIDADSYSTRALAQTVPSALRLLGSRPMESTPGTKWSYNGTNYMLLGMLIETLSGRSFAEFCRTRLFEPLGLRTPVFGDFRSVVVNRATVYTRFRFDTNPPQRLDHSEVLDYEMPPFSYPAAGLNISIQDFAAWMIALEQGRIISRRGLEELWEPARFSDGTVFQGSSATLKGYGLGWVLDPRSIHPTVGGTGGLRCAFAIYPKDNLSVVVLTNFQGAGPEALVEGVANLYLKAGPF
jgi:CubicO group peptidase (beta-lactamase class C family)